MRRQSGHGVMLMGAGAFLPGAPIPFDEADQVLGEFQGVDQEFRRWYSRMRRTMKQLLGIKHYYYALDPATRLPTETPSSMATKAGQRALEAAHVSPEEVDILYYAGASQDCYVAPPTSVFVQEQLGIKRCAEVSIHSNCTSTYKALQLAADQIAYGRYRTALITSANMISVGYKQESFATAHLTRHQAMLRLFLSDGAGAIVLQRDEGQQGGLEVYDSFLESVGTGHAPHMFTRFGSAENPLEAIPEGLHHLTQDFQQVSTIGPAIFIDGLFRFASQLEIDPNDEATVKKIRYLLANIPADHLREVGIEVYSSRGRLPADLLRERYYSTVAERGYTGPAAILITLTEILRNGTLKDGDYVMSMVTESSKWMNAGFLLRYRQ